MTGHRRVQRQHVHTWASMATTRTTTRRQSSMPSWMGEPKPASRDVSKNENVLQHAVRVPHRHHMTRSWFASSRGTLSLLHVLRLLLTPLCTASGSAGRQLALSDRSAFTGVTLECPTNTCLAGLVPPAGDGGADACSTSAICLRSRGGTGLRTVCCSSCWRC